MTTTSLALTPDQTGFTPAQVAALRQIGVDGATDEDLQVFFHQAQRSGLDPFARQIYMIGRYDSRSRGTRYTIQTSIDGFRLIAARVAERMGVPLSISAPLLASPQDGTWHEVLPAGQVPLAAKVTVKLGDGRFDAVARMDEYCQTNREGRPTAMWAKMPTTMIGKCAESLALRKACPLDLSGLYTDAEMAQADNPAPAPHPTPQPAPQPAPQPVASEGEQRERVLSEIKTMLTKASCDTSTAPVIYEMAVEAGATGSPDALRAWMRQAWREHALSMVHLGEVEAEDEAEQAEQPTLDGDVIAEEAHA